MSHQKVRLVKFQQSTTVTYVLEFGQGYLRFITQGGSVVEPAIGITNITQANPGVVSAVNTYTLNELVYISGVVGMPQINNRYFIVTALTGASFALADAFTAQPINTSGYDPYITGGIVQRVYTIGTPYLASELAMLKFSQNAAVMNITHPQSSSV